MLRSKFFKVIDKSFTEEGLKVKIEIDPQHEIFEGHFPGNPVVPGVCMLQMLTDILEKQHSKKILLRSARNMKYVATIQPKETTGLFYLIKEKPTEKGLKIQATLQNEETVFFKFSGVFE